MNIDTVVIKGQEYSLGQSYSHIVRFGTPFACDIIEGYIRINSNDSTPFTKDTLIQYLRDIGLILSEQPSDYDSKRRGYPIEVVDITGVMLGNPGVGVLNGVHGTMNQIYISYTTYDGHDFNSFTIYEGDFDEYFIVDDKVIPF